MSSLLKCHLIESGEQVSTTNPDGTLLEDEPDDAVTTQRRQLLLVWLLVGSAIAAMTAVGWYRVVKLGGIAPGGDMSGHAATAEWLDTLPGWDWRGWSDWFYGGQAIGVNYPPLGPRLDALHPSGLRADAGGDRRPGVVAAVGARCAWHERSV